MKNTTLKTQNNMVQSALSAVTLAVALFAASTEVHAYDLQANTIYANTSGGIYKIELDTFSASKVADTNASLSSIQDIAFDGETLYGINLHWQLLKLEPWQTETVAVNQASSYSLQFQGLEARNGVLYGAETRSLVTIDQQTAATGSPGPGATSYGLGAGEQITDLAFDDAGTLYAAVNFPGIPYSYLGTLDPGTGTLNLVGNSGVENIRALTVKDDVIYAMDAVGDLFTLNTTSGYATQIATAVLPGVLGMDTSPAAATGNTDIGMVDGGNNAGGDTSSGGSLSAFWGLLVVLLAGLRRFS